MAITPSGGYKFVICEVLFALNGLVTDWELSSKNINGNNRHADSTSKA